MYMNTEMNFKIKAYWNALSGEDRIKLLNEHKFWEGFSNYRYEYIPEDLKTIIALKIDLNNQIDTNVTMIS